MPEYQKQGIGSRLLQLVKEASPTMLYFGVQPGPEVFYEKMGVKKVTVVYYKKRQMLVWLKVILQCNYVRINT